MDELLVSEIKVIYEKSGDSSDEDYVVSGFVNWQPGYDLYIVDEMVFITIELPGVHLKDITIYVGQNHLIISGLKNPLIVEDKKKGRENIIFHNLEISYGRFARYIDFPIPVEPKCGTYKLENGVLTIKFPVLKEHIIPIEEA